MFVIRYFQAIAIGRNFTQIVWEGTSMNKKILFSPVSGADPISEHNLYDGPLLHIARHYKPDMIYLYMSKEILEKHEQDDRYRYCLKKLGEKLNHNFEVKIIERKELEQVQLFDTFYRDFGDELKKIQSTTDETDEILLNISSGTPAMKSALFVLATMMDISCQCIQVDTPEGKMNQHKHSKVYDVEEYWEVNIDNELTPEDEKYNRTHGEKLISLKRIKYEQIIKKYIEGYDYHAALMLAEGMNPNDTVQYIEKLKLADARQQLKFKEVDGLLKKHDPLAYSPVRDNEEKRRIYEYMLTLQARVSRAEYADFLRSLSPIFVELFKGILLKQTSSNIDEVFYYEDKMLKWNLEKVQNFDEVKSILEESKDKTWVKTWQLIKLIEKFVKNIEIVDCAKKLRNIESTVRNMAAHNMIDVSDNWIKRKTRYTSSEILDLMKEAFKYTSYNIKKEDWKSYDKMNKDIIREI